MALSHFHSSSKEEMHIHYIVHDGVFDGGEKEYSEQRNDDGYG